MLLLLRTSIGIAPLRKDQKFLKSANSCRKPKIFLEIRKKFTRGTVSLLLALLLSLSLRLKFCTHDNSSKYAPILMKLGQDIIFGQT